MRGWSNRGLSVALLNIDPTETLFNSTRSPIRQTVHVTFEYGVHFTRGLFEASNPLFYDVVSGDAGRGPKKVLVVIERPVADARPDLIGQITAYCARYPRSIELVRDPLVVEGGEAAKNEIDVPALVQQCVND